MNTWWRPVQHLWTLLIVVIGWVLFRCDSIEQAFQFLSVMSGIAGTEDTSLTVSILLNSKVQLELGAAIILSFPLFTLMKKGYSKVQQKCGGTALVVMDSVVYSSHLIFLSLLTYFTVISLAAGVYNPFIYFRF